MLGERWRGRGVVVGTVALAVVTLAHVAYYFPRVVDDLFISLRYAENLARGEGAVYNPGERVEGYSGPLWMFLQSLGFLLHVDGVTWTKLLALASLGALQAGLFFLTRRCLGVAGPLAWAPSFFCAANSYVVNWSLLGLETPLHLAALVWCPVAISAFLALPSRRTAVWAILSVVVLGLTRPESPLYVAANLVAPLLVERRRESVLRIARRLLRVAAPAAAFLALCWLARRAYYGHWLPNTYFVKGAHRSFELRKLLPLIRQGAGLSERGVYVFGATVLAIHGARRRCLAPALTVAVCLYFTATVVPDWMPSLRHLLPVTVLAPVGLVVFADVELATRRREHVVLGVAALLLGLHAAMTIVAIDNRFSAEERRDRPWVLAKSRVKLHDTLLAYRREEPPHVKEMDAYEMGQISQCWGVFEASAAPVSESWFVGRDIGAVGYFTGVRVFDTAGLVTEVVSHAREWTTQRQVPAELIRAAMAHKPVAGEIYEGWERALGAQPALLAGYQIRRGSPESPTAFVATDRPHPTPAEVVRRYRAAAARFPTLYHLHTLYGESVGAVIERRLRIVESASAGTAAPAGR